LTHSFKIWHLSFKKAVKRTTPPPLTKKNVVKKYKLVLKTDNVMRGFAAKKKCQENTQNLHLERVISKIDGQN